MIVFTSTFAVIDYRLYSRLDKRAKYGICVTVRRSTPSKTVKAVCNGGATTIGGF